MRPQVGLLICLCFSGPQFFLRVGGRLPFQSRFMNKHKLIKALCANLLLFAALTSGFLTEPVRAQTPTNLPTIDLYLGMHRLKAELAIEPPDRATGLMWRKSMPENQGMLFVFESHAIHCFWMRNTFIPLSIAFLRDDGSIVNIEDMQPQQLTSHCPIEPVRYALEVNQGWFAKRNIQPPLKVRGLPD